MALKKFKGIIEKLSREMDRLAGICVVGMMLLVVGNVILRGVFAKPISGTYEIAGYLAALAISFALAFCGLQGGHISADILFKKAPAPVKRITELVVNLTFSVFWGLIAWQVWLYAASLKQTGVVSSTAQIPVYPVVFLIGLGVLALGLASVVKFIDAVAGLSSLKTESETERFIPQAELMAEVGESR